MARNVRTDVGGIIYHAINRANARMQIFDDLKDYRLFETTLAEAKEKVPMRILSYRIMPKKALLTPLLTPLPVWCPLFENARTFFERS